MDISIGILVAGEPPDELKAGFPDYGHMVAELLQAGGKELRFTAYAVRNGEFPQALDDHDAYLITGSRFSAYDDLPWIHRLADVIRELHARRTPLIGICFGHQLIAQALGGRVERARAGWGVGVLEARVEAPAPWMAAAGPAVALIASHQDQVTQLPAGAECIAGSDFCPIAMYHIGDHVFALQSHPEFSREYSRALMKARRGVIDDERIARGLASLGKHIDAEQVARWMLEFLRRGVAARRGARACPT